MSSQNRQAFTMIELVFVIVIIGILAAVAIPKLLNTAEAAKENNILSFMGTLNRSVSPILWANHLTSDNGSVKSVTMQELLDIYTELPKGITNIDFSQCADANGSTGAKIGDITTEALPVAEELFCRDGDGTHNPKFAFSADLNTSLQHNH